MAQALRGMNVLLVKWLAIEQRRQSGHELVHGGHVDREAGQFRLQMLLLEQLQRQPGHGVHVLSHVARRDLTVV